MTQPNLDALLDHVAGQVVLLNPRQRPPAWSPEEDEFVKKNLGWLTDEEMGQALGRSAIAVHLRWSRDLGLPSPSKHPDVVTAQQAAKMLGIDAHKIAHWVDMGLIPGRLMAGARKMRLIDRLTFRRWVLNPMNWVYFRIDRIQDPELRRMCAKRAARWGDEWWTTKQAADHHGTTTGEIKRYVQLGRLKSFHLPVSLGGRNVTRAWSNHFVLRSEVLRLEILGRGEAHLNDRHYTPAADAWILKARDELGMTFVHIGRTMKIGAEVFSPKTGTATGNPTISYRYRQLKARQAKKRKSTKR